MEKFITLKQGAANLGVTPVTFKKYALNAHVELVGIGNALAIPATAMDTIKAAHASTKTKTRKLPAKLQKRLRIRQLSSMPKKRETLLTAFSRLTTVDKLLNKLEKALEAEIESLETT